MNLYKIKFAHYAPKDSEHGIKTLLLAENDEQVYDWISDEPEVDGFGLFNSWKDKERYKYNEEAEAFLNEDGDDDGYSWYDVDGNPETIKERMLRLKGEIEDDDVDFSDSYYGITLFGWELLKENTEADYSELIEMGIVFKA